MGWRPGGLSHHIVPAWCLAVLVVDFHPTFPYNYSMVNTDEILGIAAITRRSCEAWNSEHELFGDDLACMCLIASHFLFRVLKENGYMPRFHKATKEYWGCHCWVSVGRLHLDITATQFAPVAPVFHYTGTKSDHPVLKAYFGPREPTCFPQTFTLYSGNSEERIADIVSDWGDDNVLTPSRADELKHYYRSIAC